MTESENANKRAIMVAAGMVVCLLALSGVGYRLLAEHLAGSGDGALLPPGTLAGLPMRIGEWDGKDMPLTEAVIRATDTDDHVSRMYSPRVGGERVWLFVAYGVRARDLMPHRPEVCYPGNGWTIRDTRDVELPLGDESRLQCRILRFSQAGLSAKAVTVLNYYIVDGQYCPDVSLLRSKAWLGSRGVRYIAQVQITCSSDSALSPDSAARSVRAFAVDSARAIHSLMPDVRTDVAENDG